MTERDSFLGDLCLSNMLGLNQIRIEIAIKRAQGWLHEHEQHEGRFCTRQWKRTKIFKKKNPSGYNPLCWSYPRKSWVCKLPLVISKFRVQQHKPTHVWALASHLVMFVPWISNNFISEGAKNKRETISVCHYFPKHLPPVSFQTQSFLRCVCRLQQSEGRSDWLTVVGSEEEAVPPQVSWRNVGGASDSYWWENCCLKCLSCGWLFQQLKDLIWQRKSYVWISFSFQVQGCGKS